MAGVLRFEAVEVNFEKYEAHRDGSRVDLTPKEFAMLRLLLETPGEPVSRDRFLDVVWGYTAFPTTRTVDKHVAGLRAKIEVDPDRPQWIDHLDADRLKVKLATSLASISGVHLLRTFIDVHTETETSGFMELNYEIAIHMVFIFSALILAWIAKILEKPEHHAETNVTGREKV